MAITLALSTLCENPRRRTGLTTLFHEFVRQALAQFPEVRWVVFAGPRQRWDVLDERVDVVRDFPANDRRWPRLWADHFFLAPAAARRDAAALLTVGFVPLRSAGLPVVMHVFSLHHQRQGGPGALYRRASVARGLRRAALVIANSRWTASQLGERRGPMLVSHEGVEHARFKPDGVSGAPGVAGDYLLWVSNFYAYKRAELVLAAYARHAPEWRARYPLLLVGGDWRGGINRARARAQALGIERDVRFLGWVDDDMLPALYRGARVHVLSTSEETFGRSVAEAMACGCPCLLQDLPVLREVTGGAACFTDFAHPEAAGAALRQMAEDETLRSRLRAAGLRQAREFSFEQLARERLTAILPLVGRRR